MDVVAAQARAANQSVKVIVGLTTGAGATPGTIYAAWSSVRDTVDGFYLSTDDARADTAVSFLRMLPR